MTTNQVTIEIPSPLRRFTDNKAEIELQSAASVQQALAHLVQEFPALRHQLLAKDGELFKFIGVFVNGNDIRQLADAATAVRGGDTISLVPAIAGG